MPLHADKANATGALCTPAAPEIRELAVRFAELVREPLVFIDLETTGANFANDRIIEIGLVEVDADGAREWSSLVDPEAPISAFITGLTGIDASMTATAPRFAALADELAARLHGRLLVAHNSRFDYGFLRREFARVGVVFRAPTLCTVRLSRRLFPQHHRHSLAALLERHGVAVDARHRALADARALWDLWRCWCAELAPETVWAEVPDLVGRAQLPPQIDPAVADDLPESAGAFALIDGAGALLHVARSANVRRQALALLAPDRWESALARATQRIEWVESAGELGARLAEFALKAAQRVLPPDLCAWRLVDRGGGDFRPQLVYAHETDFAAGDDLYGLYSTRREALFALRKLAEAHRLCFTQLGLGDSPAGKPCVAYRRSACRGACIGKESAASHAARLHAALARIRCKRWPYAGPVAIVEADEFGLREDFHVVDRWRWLTSVDSAAAAAAFVSSASALPAAAFDAEIYRLLSRFVHAGKLRIVPLTGEQAPAR